MIRIAQDQDYNTIDIADASRKITELARSQSMGNRCTSNIFHSRVCTLCPSINHSSLFR